VQSQPQSYVTSGNLPGYISSGDTGNQALFKIIPVENTGSGTQLYQIVPNDPSSSAVFGVSKPVLHNTHSAPSSTYTYTSSEQQYVRAQSNKPSTQYHYSQNSAAQSPTNAPTIYPSQPQTATAYHTHTPVVQPPVTQAVYGEKESKSAVKSPALDSLTSATEDDTLFAKVINDLAIEDEKVAGQQQERSGRLSDADSDDSVGSDTGLIYYMAAPDLSKKSPESQTETPVVEETPTPAEDEVHTYQVE